YIPDEDNVLKRAGGFAHSGLTEEFTAFTFCFPAFLIHDLNEGRKLYREKHGKTAKDLWPVVTN
ncbi:MAG: hypothetical protein C4519_07210, partial [Desulfobacteraceae bacterium]